MAIKRPEDYGQRLQALDPTRSFLCEAPAGSGKTELLSQRFLTLLSGVSRPEELLAITFTRKATAAMRDRVIGALLGAREPEPDHDNQRITWRAARAALAANDKYGWDLLSNPNRLQIRTFDSFCAQLNRALPLHSTFGAPPEITAEPEELYRRAVRQLFLDLDQEASWAGALGGVLRHLDNNFQSLEELFIRLLRRREEWLPLVNHGATMTAIRARLEQHLQHVNDDVVARLTQIIPAAWQRRLLELAGFAAANLQKLDVDSSIRQCLDLDQTAGGLPDSSETGIRQWSGILELLLTRQGQWRTAVDKRIGFPPGTSKVDKPIYQQRKELMIALLTDLQSIAGLEDALHDLRHVPSVQYADQQMQVLADLTTLLPVLTAHLTLVFSERNCVDFTEMNIKARQALGGLEAPTDLALALDYRIRHILVDEFQDVSTAQVVLLRQLTAGWQPGDGHTLFCVGDAMQSIYGFRDANVGVFIHCEEHGLGQVPLNYLRLNTNFRSHAGIVDWVNTIFAPVFPAQNDISSGAVKYSAAVAYDQASPVAAVQIRGFSGNAAAAAEAQAVVDIIRGIRRDTPKASIAILVRNRNHAGHIVSSLQDAGMRYRAVDLEPLSQHSVIQDLLSLCRALLHPADRVAWLAVLRAPWCGLTLADLLALVNTGGEINHLTLTEQLQFCVQLPHPENPQPQLSDDGRARLARVAPVLLRALATQGRKPLRQWLEGTWLELGGPACLADPADLVNAEMLFALLETLDDGTGLLEQATLNRAVAGLYAAPDPVSDDKLQIMTIHKAKGLEFDAVIVPSLQRTPRRTTPELIRWQERLTAGGEREIIMAPIPARGGEGDRVYDYLQEQQRQKEAYETGRLLYVACTRARRQLYLLTHVQEDDRTASLRAPAKASLLSAIWPSVQPELQMQTELQANTTIPVTQNPVKPLRRLSLAWQLPRLTERDLLSGFIDRTELSVYASEEEGQAADMDRDGFNGQDPTARHVGTVVHQVLQEIGRSGLADWDAARLGRCRPYWRARLATLGVPSSMQDQALADVRATLLAVLQDSRFQWLFSDQHTLRRCEYAVSIPVAQGYRNLVIDLLLQEQNGKTWIIDYKTGRPGPQEDLDQFIERQMQRYGNKMELYRHAVSQLGFPQVRSALYFPLLKKLSEYVG